MSSLLEPAFLHRLSRLHLVARRRFLGGSSGSRRSSRRGASAEFAEHRPYYAGDDVRRIDWNAYARLEELVLRLFVAEDDLSLYLLVDRSASLAFGAPTKLEIAKQIAAALAFVGLSGSERVAVFAFDETLSMATPATRGRRRIGAVLRHLDAITAGSSTSLSRAVDALLAQRPRPGLVALISDFLDPEGFERPIDRLLARGFEPVLFHVIAHEELDPEPGADVVLVDSESGHRVEVSLDARAIRAYRARLDAFCAELEGHAKKRGLFYARAETRLGIEGAVLGYLRGEAR